MKKALGVLSVLVLITAMMISCNAEQKLDDTVGVSFNVSSSRELSVENQPFEPVNSENLTWYYHGEKKTDKEFTTGQSASMDANNPAYWTEISTGDELSGKYVTFSQGQWFFKIKAMKGNTQMYYGETNGNVLLTKGNNTISISVSPFVSGVKGTLEIESVYIDPKDQNSPNVAPNRLLINGVSKTFTVDEGGKSISYTEKVEPGTYTVEVKRVGEDTGIILASASKTVIVYSGLTTKIKDFVEEDTTSGKFDPKPIKPEGTETVTVPESGDAVVEFVNITPSMEADKSTTVTIPSAVVASAASAVTLDIAVKDSESVADSSFDVTSGNGVAASISLTMKDGETPITNFGSNKVTVETYIETGLSGVTVKYNGTGDAPTDVDYDSVTGKLTFKTTHFSEFYVESAILTKIGDKEYLSLQRAINDAEDNSTISLLADVETPDTSYYVENKNLTLNLNGKTLSGSGYDGTLCVKSNATLTINGEGNVIGNDDQEYGMAIWAVGENAKVIINSGTYSNTLTHADDQMDMIYASNGGKVEIYGGVFKCITPAWTLNVKDADYVSGASNITVYGGKFHGFNPANCEAEGSGTNFMKEWFSAKEKTTGVYEVCSAYEDDVINISSAKGLLEFARLVNEEGKTFSGKTVKLVNDINLAGIVWNPVGQTGGYTAKTYFQGTFDGNGKTISNLTIPESSWEAGSNYGENYATGFFGFIDEGGNTIKNVTFEKANVAGHHWVGIAAGYMTGTVSGVKVKDSTITSTYETSKADGDKAGGVVGYLNKGTISGCTVTESTISADRDSGSVVGYSNGIVTKNTAQLCTVYYSTNDDTKIGGEIAGKRSIGVSDNTATNVSVIKAVSNADELSAALNHTYNSNTTIKLMNNIVLSGEWGEHVLNLGPNVTVTIDGNSKTISGLTTSTTTNVAGFQSNGLISGVNTPDYPNGPGTLLIKDLTISDATVSSTYDSQLPASAALVGSINNTNFTATSVTITGARVSSDFYAGGIVGYVQGNYYVDIPVNITKCTVTSSIFNGNDATGALVALNNETTVITDATVTGNAINGGDGYSASALVGTSMNDTTATGVTVSGNTFSITNDNGYQKNDSTYGYIYHNDASYSVNGTNLK